MVRVGAWMSLLREQSQVGHFTPRPHFIVLTIAQRAWVRVRVRVRVGAWMSQCREQSQVGRFTPRPCFIVIVIAQHAQQRVRPHAE